MALLGASDALPCPTLHAVLRGCVRVRTVVLDGVGAAGAFCGSGQAAPTILVDFGRMI